MQESQDVSTIITFYDLNEVILNRKKIYRYLGEEERPIENRGYNTEKIRKMLQVSDEKVRAILLLLASRGCELACGFNIARFTRGSRV